MSDPARLRLFQLVSPALPVGAFSYSEGLEVLVQGGQLGSVEALEAWLQAELQRGAVAVEAAAISGLQAHLQRWRTAVAAAGPEDPAAITARAALLERDGWLLAQREAPEVRAQQRQMGQSLLQLLADLGFALPASPPAPAHSTAMSTATSTALPPLAWPAAFAWAACSLELAAPAANPGDGLARDWPAPAADVHKHYGYAFQWFSLSALTVILYVWFQVLRPRRRPA